MDKHELHRKTLKDATKCARKGRGERDVAVDHCRGAKARVHLNDLDLQPLRFEVTFLQRHIERHGRAAAACISDPYPLRRIRAPSFIACPWQASGKEKQPQKIKRSFYCIHWHAAF